MTRPKDKDVIEADGEEVTAIARPVSRFGLAKASAVAPLPSAVAVRGFERMRAAEEVDELEHKIAGYQEEGQRFMRIAESRNYEARRDAEPSASRAIEDLSEGASLLWGWLQGDDQ